MKLKELIQWVDEGREIEFDYEGKRYSITYFYNGDKREISFCEFYKDPTDVTTVEQLLRIPVNNKPLEKVWEKLRLEDMDIF